MVMGDTRRSSPSATTYPRAQDRYSLLSQQRTARAASRRFFKEEMARCTYAGHLRQTTSAVVGQEPYYVERTSATRDTTSKAS